MEWGLGLGVSDFLIEGRGFQGLVIQFWSKRVLLRGGGLGVLNVRPRSEFVLWRAWLRFWSVGVGYSLCLGSSSLAGADKV